MMSRGRSAIDSEMDERTGRPIADGEDLAHHQAWHGHRALEEKDSILDTKDVHGSKKNRKTAPKQSCLGIIKHCKAQPTVSTRET
ncbi:hypothetical protein O181_008330 [Austropuccinia psidii MF-1]|uniref:Uncharacterized protein n=1 Tax=Austropuccinia psidii MF-1 TaxID=1389203 RepID=A0A9Q3BPQ6_9BASI|nr:hypothetical protein [Austropuccinia psidii MF-1]